MDALLRELDQGARLVTATRRLARHLHARHAAEKRVYKRSWPTPSIDPWPDWLAGGWGEAVDAQHGPAEATEWLLDEAQELLLWERCIAERVRAAAEHELLRVSATARVARDTWRLMRAWNLQMSDVPLPVEPDTAAFLDWAGGVVQSCRERGWVLPADLAARLADFEHWRPAGPIVWVGFDELTPAQQRLRTALQQRGVEVRLWNPPSPASRPRVVACPDPRTEIEAAARWARGLLENGESGPLAVVVPDLSKRRDEVEHVFLSMLHPDAEVGQDPAFGRLFHLSLGQPLNAYPVVAAALRILRFASGPQPIREVTSLLHCPFLVGGIQEATGRARLDRALRELGWDKTGVSGLLQVLNKSGIRRECETFAEALRVAGAIQIDPAGAQPPGRWAALFSDWLRAFGWPGTRTLDSAEYQTVKAWRDLLSGFAGTAIVVPHLQLHDAVARLERMAADRVFQPESVPDPPPVQIMGVAETTGISFTHLWLTGMGDDRWPPPPRPNPFLPWALQRRHRFPEVDAERVLADAEQTTRRLLGAAPSVWVSFTHEQADGQTRRVSALFSVLTADAGEAVPCSDFAGRARVVQRERPGLERVRDDHGPPVETGEVVRGGVAIFRDFAACPFRAYARHRLRAEPLAEAEPGLTAAERGTLVHECLNRVWRRLGHHQRMARLDRARLAQTMEREIDGALVVLRSRMSDPFRRKFLQLERDRLRTLLEQWFDVERQRPPFAVIDIERRITATIAGIEIALRLDRVDRVDESLMIIDYKTGRGVRTEDWFGGRPDDPQLPLYVLSTSEQVDALAYAHVRLGKCGLKGLARREDLAHGVTLLPGQSTDGDNAWYALRSGWRETMERLGAEFRAGVAAVDPKRVSTCEYCDVGPLCRIFETKAVGATQDNDSAVR